MSIYIVGGGADVFVILNMLLIFLDIGKPYLDYFACYLVR